MLDLWNSTEPFLQVLYIVILVCIPLLLLSIYKVWRWTRREDVVKRFEQHRQKQRSRIFYKLYIRIGKLRAIWYCGGFAVIIALSGDAARISLKGLAGLLLALPLCTLQTIGMSRIVGAAPPVGKDSLA